MSNKIDYVVDLRHAYCDIDTAAIMAADFNVVFIVEDDTFFTVEEKDPLHDKILWMSVGNFEIEDVLKILLLKFDLSNAYLAEIVSGGIKLVKKCLLEPVLDKIRKTKICSPFEIRTLSKEMTVCKDSLVDVKLQSFVFSIFTALDNISFKELSIFCGTTSLTDSEIHKARHYSYKQSLAFNEIKYLGEYYKKNLINQTLAKRVSSLISIRQKKIDALMISFYKANGEFSEFSGFPVVFKYLAAYLLICSQYKASFQMFNSAFLYAFRSLDWLCDGVLIMIGDAKIDSKGTHIDELFILENSKINRPMGFGAKWKKLSTCQLFKKLKPETKTKIDEYIQVRNHHAMTHGTLRISDTYYMGFQKVLLEFFSEIDILTNANGFTMANVMNEFDNIFNINLSDFVFESICSEFNFESNYV
ncbi:hypothetical protein [Enterobacter hormaechei]|uniref:hypothetical protein n=1 Tax=Enterobacter hormaechei TaxID=158836 RepID=UPI0007B3B38F|nr:hypothetical protein [Enterobacter hormaechei]KZP76207.1 hypothetical protein A3N41_12230 [Enterobacter hormaechei subsp. steigerwaltii]HAV1800523.1 hypothetical protein [Enterobacter hormaechei subsp. steigerwaltii]HAV1804168.1 hypothetical protein [Enterobacter hormaechei subsp. steigerwaltii]